MVLMKARTFRLLGFLLYVVGLGWTLFNPNWYAFIIWFSGLGIYYVFDIRNERERARIVQEAQ